jgi:hypothetical protein
MTSEARLAYRNWCLQKLTAQAYVVYEICQDLGEGLTTIRAIAAYADCKSDTASAALKVLHKYIFIRYANLGASYGISLDWIRSTIDQVPPTEQACRQKRLALYGHTFVDTHGKIHRISPGNLQKFCTKNELNYRCMQYLLNGEISNHKGWRLSSR